MRAPPTALVPEPVMDLRVPMETGIIVNVVDRTRMITPGHLVEKEQIGLGIKHGSEVVQKPSRLHLHTAKHPSSFCGFRWRAQPGACRDGPTCGEWWSPDGNWPRLQR